MGDSGDPLLVRQFAKQRVPREGQNMLTERIVRDAKPTGKTFTVWDA